MPIRKGFAKMLEGFPGIKLANPVSDSDVGCTECMHTMFIPCFDHPYCINPKSSSYGYHYHGWDAACEFFEAGKRYMVFECPFFDGDSECDYEKRGEKRCPYGSFD